MTPVLFVLILYFNIITTLKYQKVLQENKSFKLKVFLLFFLEVSIIDIIIYNVFYALRG